MKYLEKERGITLLSLVVTLIVMIILAGVALRLGIGNNGLIGMVSNTVGQYQNATEQEKEGQDEFVDTFNELLNDNTPRRYFRQYYYFRKANHKYCRMEFYWRNS